MVKYKGVIKVRTGGDVTLGKTASTGNYHYTINRQPGGILKTTSNKKFAPGDLVTFDMDTSGTIIDISKT